MVLFCLSASTLKAQVNCSSQASHRIHEVQGNDSSSPIQGTTVTLRGVVTADFTDPDELQGFFLQEELTDQDDDPQTSEGIFVFYTGSNEVVPGSTVTVRGTVEEFNGKTEITDSELAVCASGTVLQPVEIDDWRASVEFAEAYEGMLVSFQDSFVITEIDDVDRFGELQLSPFQRQPQFTERNLPGSQFTTYENNARRKRILLDDQRDGSDQRPVYHLANNPGLRAGQLATNLRGIVDYAFNQYRLRPVSPILFSGNPAPAVEPLSSGNLRIATFNLQNYFNGNGQGSGFSEGRGADNLADFQQQTTKLVAAILGLGADLIGVQELENDYPDRELSAIAQLIGALNEELPSGQEFAYIDPGTFLGGDAIAVGLIYRRDVLQPVGAPAGLNEPFQIFQVEPSNRVALAQTFELVLQEKNRARFTAVVNHYKSKGPSGFGNDPNDNPANDNQEDGQSFWNQLRSQASTALVEWLDTDPTDSQDDDFVIMGDLNAYSMEDPIQILQDAGYTKAVSAGDYSLEFGGFWGMLDHLLFSPDMLPQFREATVWHINADEPEIKGYASDEDAYIRDGFRRSSDHDPVIASFQLQADGIVSTSELAYRSTFRIRKWPVPANGFRLSCLSSSSEPLRIRVYNSLGQELYRSDRMLQPGVQEWQLPSELSSYSGTIHINLLLDRFNTSRTLFW